MYKVVSIINNACNLELNHKYRTKKEALDCLEGLRVGASVLLGERQYDVKKLTKDVYVYTLNLDEHRVYTFYLIKETK